MVHDPPPYHDPIDTSGPGEPDWEPPEAHEDDGPDDADIDPEPRAPLPFHPQRVTLWQRLFPPRIHRCIYCNHAWRARNQYDLVCPHCHEESDPYILGRTDDTIPPILYKGLALLFLFVFIPLVLYYAWNLIFLYIL